jgi:hypothetical protein
MSGTGKLSKGVRDPSFRFPTMGRNFLVALNTARNALHGLPIEVQRESGPTGRAANRGEATPLPLYNRCETSAPS